MCLSVVCLYGRALLPPSPLSPSPLPPIPLSPLPLPSLPFPSLPFPSCPSALGVPCGDRFCFNGGSCGAGGCKCLDSYTGDYCQYRDCKLGQSISDPWVHEDGTTQSVHACFPQVIPLAWMGGVCLANTMLIVHVTTATQGPTVRQVSCMQNTFCVQNCF